MVEYRLYFPLSEYLERRFSARVYKITLDAGFTCPTRDGTKGKGGCLYCDQWGSGNRLAGEGKDLGAQISMARESLSRKRKAEKYFLYFQSFTNTYAPVERLKEIYDEALSYDRGDIVGLIIGTRPDCIDEEKLKLLSSYTDKYEVWVEYGLQSIYQKSLDFLERGHTLADYLRAVQMTDRYHLNITTHIITGLPTETREEMVETAKFLADTGYSDAVKIHSLYIPKSSRLARIYQEEKLKLLTLEEYAETVADILEVLPKNIIIARMTGETNREDLVAPLWVLDKQIVIKRILEIMKQRGSYQGKNYIKQ
ncbi:MAG: TIGR01212 family radical SAM protein [Spirochaetes bacterium]|nr:TIGR01212 family radical SAM protein [Spirochaetota bacterium]